MTVEDVMKKLAWFALLVVLALGCTGKTESSNGRSGKTKGNSKELGEPALTESGQAGD